MRKLIAVISFCFPLFLSGQGIGIGTTSPDASAQLEVNSTSKGFLLPRMTTAQRTTIISPANGLLVYDIDTKTFWYRDVAVWKEIGTSSSSSGWSITGNSGTDTAINFIGTTDSKPITFRINNSYAGRLDAVRNTFFFGRGSGNTPNIGTNNIGIGRGVMSQTQNTINESIAFGDSALAYAKNPDEFNFRNIAIGQKALIRSEAPNNHAIGFFALYSNTSGTNNIGFGRQPLMFNQTGNSNIAIGSLSLYSNNGGNYNVAMGDFAMNGNLNGSRNVAVGHAALSAFNSINMNENVAIGDSAMANARYDASFGNSYSVAVGTKALKNSQGYWNTAVGYYSMMSNTIGDINTAVGSQALRSNTTGNNNNAFGYAAMYDNIDGSNNVAFGNNALSTNLGGTSNIAIGNAALLNNKNSYNVAIGAGAMLTNTEGNRNVAIGNGVMRFAENDMTGNVAIGDSAMAFAQNDVESNTSLSVAIGLKALKHNQGNRNSAVGYNAMEFNTTGDKNTAFGYKVMELNVSGTDNVSIGAFTLNNNISGNANVAIGYAALASNTTNYNVAIGHNAMQAKTSGSRSIAIGNGALYQAVIAEQLIAIGDSAMANSQGSIIPEYVGTIAIGNGALKAGGSSQNLAIGTDAMSKKSVGGVNISIGNYAMKLNVTGEANVAIGHSAMSFSTIGWSNTVLGTSSLGNKQSGSDNTALGAYAGLNNINGSGNVFIGVSAGRNSNNSNQLYIENSSADSTEALIFGEFDNDKLRFNASTFISQDLSLKKSVRPALGSGAAINIINPGNFSFIEVSSNAAFSVHGVLDASGNGTTIPPDGKILTIWNNSTFNMTIANENPVANNINQIRTLTGASISTTGTGTITLQYAAGLNKWIVIASQL
jgi:hypothetical protein